MVLGSCTTFCVWFPSWNWVDRRYAGSIAHKKYQARQSVSRSCQTIDLCWTGAEPFAFAGTSLRSGQESIAVITRCSFSKQLTSMSVFKLHVWYVICLFHGCFLNDFSASLWSKIASSWAAGRGWCQPHRSRAPFQDVKIVRLLAIQHDSTLFNWRQLIWVCGFVDISWYLMRFVDIWELRLLTSIHRHYNNSFTDREKQVTLKTVTSLVSS